MRRLLLAAQGGSSTVILGPVLGAPSFYSHTQLTIPTYDGSDQCTHPGVVKIPGGWHGWIYWMAMTPLFNNDSSYENPSVVVSNDGTTWQVPPGGTNPVESGSTSDPDLVFWNDTLYLFWRTSGAGPGDKVHVASSTDGITWTSGSTILSDVNTALLSPALIREVDGTWRLWAINMTASPNTLRMWTATDPLGPWSGPTACTASDPEGRDLWHSDVTLDGTTYRMLLTTCTLGTSGGSTRLLLGSSTDAVTWSFSTAVFNPTGGSNFDADGIYRSSGFFEQSRWRVWYGAFIGTPSPTAWHIGYTEVDPADFP